METNNDNKNYIIRMAFSILIILLLWLIELPNTIENIILALAYILAAYEVLLQAVKNILKGEIFDENFLMGFASLGAFIIGERTEAIAVLIFYGLGEMLEDMAIDKSKRNISELMDIRPEYANVEMDSEVIQSHPEDVKINDIILIKPGERIPLDGIVISGNSFVDAKALTGESLPVEVFKDDRVLSGSINMNGLIRVRVDKNYSESTVSKILDLVENASSNKAESEKFITKFARYYTPIVVFLAACVSIIPPILGFGSFSMWIYRALSFLIISCPCALVISIPLSFLGGIGGSARHGILVKGGNYLDALNDVKVIVFDKTGTLTEGIFTVTEIKTVDGISKEEILELAAIAESKSNHPIAKSLLEFYAKELLLADHINEEAGFGITAIIGEDKILAGNAKLMKKNKIIYEEPSKTGSLVHIAKNNKYYGYILLSDKIRENANFSIKELKKYGIKKTIMLTGDSQSKAEEIAKLAGIDDFYAELLAQDKLDIFNKLKLKGQKGEKIAFVGDGINDAPVLAGSDIGIAMGGIGSDAAIEAADLVIMNDDISKIARALQIAKKTRKIVYENIILALGIKTLIMILSFYGITSIWFAIFADVGVALIALLNATRAMRI